MQIHTVYEPIDALKPHPKNPKDHDLGAIIRSIQRFGYVTPIVIDERSSLVVSGHGRIQALAFMKKDGQEPPANVELDKKGAWMVPVIHGVRFNSDAELDAFLIADNQTSFLGGWNEPALAGLLAELRERDASLMLTTGFDDEDLNDLLHILNAPDLEQAAEKFGDFDDSELWPTIKLRVAPTVYERYIVLMQDAEGETDSDKFQSLLERIQ